MPLRLSTAIVGSSTRYQALLSKFVTIGQMARYLSQSETFLDSSTLELARPVRIEQLLQELDIQSGDRLLIFPTPPKHGEFPTPLRPGDKVLTIKRGDVVLSSRGKRSLLVGKPDDSQQAVPDIDLRYLIAPELLDFISRNCLWLSFDEGRKQWHIKRTGKTRVVVDELELGSDPLPLNDIHRLRFYRAADNPLDSASLPIGELELAVEDVQVGSELTHGIESGQERITVCVGAEREGQTLSASENLRVEQIVLRLAHYNRVALPLDFSIYLAHLLPPQTPLGSLKLAAGEFLYVSLGVRHAYSVLRLYDTHNRARMYPLSALRQDENKVIGCRLLPDVRDPGLDVDLYDSVVAHDLHQLPTITSVQAHVIYRAAEDAWFIQPAEWTNAPLYLNSVRLVGTALMRLITGDVLTFGPSVHQYYARLEVEIDARTGY